MTQHLSRTIEVMLRCIFGLWRGNGCWHTQRSLGVCIKIVSAVLVSKGSLCSDWDKHTIVLFTPMCPTPDMNSYGQGQRKLFCSLVLRKESCLEQTFSDPLKAVFPICCSWSSKATQRKDLSTSELCPEIFESMPLYSIPTMDVHIYMISFRPGF